MQVEVTGKPLAEVPADLHVMAAFEGEELPAADRELPGVEDVKAGFRKVTLLRRPSGDRLLIVGLGKRSEIDAERLRVTAAKAVSEAGRYDATAIAWALPGPTPPGASVEDLAAGLVEGTILAS